MKKMDLYFQRDLIEKDWECQKGTEIYPQLSETRVSLLQALNLPNNSPDVLQMDFEKKTVTMTFSVPDMGERESAVLAALGYEYADFSNSVKLINALINGQLPRGVVEKALELEGRQNEANPLVTEFLNMLNLDGEEDPPRSPEDGEN